MTKVVQQRNNIKPGGDPNSKLSLRGLPSKWTMNTDVLMLAGRRWGWVVSGQAKPDISGTKKFTPAHVITIHSKEVTLPPPTPSTDKGCHKHILNTGKHTNWDTEDQELWNGVSEHSTEELNKSNRHHWGTADAPPNYLLQSEMTEAAKKKPTRSFPSFPDH